MNKITFFLCGCLWAVSGKAAAEALTLPRALELARYHSAELRAARRNSEAAEQAVAAAGLWINPKLMVEVEGLGGELNGFDETEYTIGLSQEFQRRAKRGSQRDIAYKAIAMASAEQAEKERTLMTEVRRAFIEVQAQQETASVQTDQLELGRAFVDVAKRRHAAGGASELDVVQAELALEEILLLQACCFGELLAAQSQLASLIGLPRDRINEVEGLFYEPESVDGMALEESHPVLQRWDAEIEKTRAEAVWAGLQDAPDIKLSTGIRYEAASDVNTFVLGMTIPLNFIRKGRAEQVVLLRQVDALEATRDEVRRRLQAELDVALALYGGALKEVELTKTKLIPKAEEAYELSRTGYEAGRFSWVELIAAQQHLADIRVRYIDSLRTAHRGYAQLAKFMKEGRSL